MRNLNLPSWTYYLLPTDVMFQMAICHAGQDILMMIT